MKSGSMILSLTKIIDNISFAEAIIFANVSNRYIRLNTWHTNLYFEIKHNDTDNCYMCRLVNISENCDVLMKQDWTTSINIDYVISNNWSVYQATIG